MMVGTGDLRPLLLLSLMLSALHLAPEARGGDKLRHAGVDVELVLAVDVSGSISSAELHLQRRGYAQAFRSPHLMDAVASGANGRISVLYVEWGGPGTQKISILWMDIETNDDAERFASRITELPMYIAGPGTSISGLLLFCGGLFEDDETIQAPRGVIDFSGNDPNNSGPPVLAARNAILARNITVNGVAIDMRPSPSRTSALAYSNQLQTHFETSVIGGPGAFAVGIGHSSEMEPAILRKLLGEIVASTPAVIRVSAADGPLSMLDCINPGQRHGR